VIVVMKKGASREQVQHMIERVEELGLKSHPIYGTERTVIAAIGDKRHLSLEDLESGPGVERVVPILAPYKMASREVHAERSEVRLANGAMLGGQRVGVIAGPCTVESREQVLEVAHAVKAAGAVALRGGAFKPRSSPYAFQGLGEEALEALARAREQTGLAVVSEILSPEQALVAGRYVDVFQVGTRNMQNFQLLRAVGQTDKPVLLKRGFSATLNEFLLAAEYIINQGNSNVILCERGIRTFEQYCRFTLALTAVPELQRVSHLPVVVDPSHGTGHAPLVAPMCLAAVAGGADGLLVEVHPNPERALVDGPQSLDPPTFAAMMAKLRRVAEAVERSL
jgi:3-deoxy-7-phosphoheptulonate synthase